MKIRCPVCKPVRKIDEYRRLQKLVNDMCDIIESLNEEGCESLDSPTNKFITFNMLANVTFGQNIQVNSDIVKIIRSDFINMLNKHIDAIKIQQKLLEVI